MADGVFKRSLRIAKIALRAKKIHQMSDINTKSIAQRALANQFSDARGTIMKIGQFLASSNENNHLQALVKGIPALPLSQLSKTIEEALGVPIHQVFKSIDESTSAASLGQVHHAILLTGEEVAVKIQYPDIAEDVHSEIKLLGLMPGIGPVKKWGFDFESYKKSFKNNMNNELNYKLEAQTQQLLRQRLTVNGLIIPKVFCEFTQKNLLIQSWETGQYLDEIGHWTAVQKKKAAEIIIETLFQSLFVTGIVHADPHIGNSYFRLNSLSEPEMVLMDFGCTININEHQRFALLKLILSVTEVGDQNISALRYFSALGFDAEKLSYIGDSLPMLTKLLFKPFSQSGTFIINHWDLEQSVNQLLGDKRWWFRSAGPSQLFLILRAFQGVIQQLALLKTNVSWSQLFFRQIDQTLIDQVNAFDLPVLPQETSLSIKNIQSVSQTLKVNVKENGHQKVNVSLPAEMALTLETLIPEDVLSLIHQHPDIDLKMIKQQIRQSGLAPQTLFHFSHGNKDYHIWLE